MSQIRASDILETPAALCRPEEYLSQVISRFSRHSLSELPVVEEDRLLGLLCLTDLLRGRRLPLSARVENLMVHPPRVGPDDNLLELAQRLLLGDYRSLPVTDAEGGLVGLAGRMGLLAKASAHQDFSGDTVAEIMTPDPRSLLPTDSLSRARSLMRSLDVRTLPVVDQAGRLIGVVGQRELLAGSEHSLTSQPSGDRSGNRDTPHLRVESLMQGAPQTTAPEEGLTRAIEQMVQANVSTLFVVEQAMLKGVLQAADVLSLLAADVETKEEVYVQLSGLDSNDSLLIEQIYDRLQRTMKIVARACKPQNCHLHFSSEGTASRSHFTVRLRLQTDKGLKLAKGEGWSEADALRETLENLETQTRRTRK